MRPLELSMDAPVGVNPVSALPRRRLTTAVEARKASARLRLGGWKPFLTSRPRSSIASLAGGQCCDGNVKISDWPGPQLFTSPHAPVLPDGEWGLQVLLHRQLDRGNVSRKMMRL